MSAEQSLADYLDSEVPAGFVAEVTEHVTEYGISPETRWRITDLDTADWALRKIKRAKAEMEANDSVAKVELERIGRWLEDVNATHQQTVERFTGLLHEYAASEVLGELADTKDWKKVHKTLSTPNGKIKARKSEDGQFSLNSDSLDDVIATLSEAGRDELVTYTPRLGATKLDEARAEGHVRLSEDGTYQVADAATGEWRTLVGVKRTGRGQISFKVELA